MPEKYPETPAPATPEDLQGLVVQQRLAQKALELTTPGQQASLAQESDAQDRKDAEDDDVGSIARRLRSNLAKDVFYPVDTNTNDPGLNRMRKSALRMVTAETGEKYQALRDRLYNDAYDEATAWHAVPPSERYNSAKFAELKEAAIELRMTQQEALNRRRAEHGQASVQEQPGSPEAFSQEVANAMNEGLFPRIMTNIGAARIRSGGQYLAILRGEIPGADTAGRPLFWDVAGSVVLNDQEGVLSPNQSAAQAASVEELFVPAPGQHLEPQAWDNLLGAMHTETQRAKDLLNPTQS